MFLALLLLASSSAVDTMMATFRAVHRDYQAQLLDKFAETTADPTVVGKRFKIVNRLSNGDAYGTAPGPWFTYSEGKLRLVFTTSKTYTSSTYSGPSFLMGIVGGARTPTRSYVGSNAYGATTRVQVEKLTENGIAFMSGPQNERVMSQENRDDLLRPPSSRYEFELVLPGPQARKVALDSAIVVEGEIAFLPEGKLGSCKPIYGQPEITHPLEVYGESCWVGANVSRVAFIRSSTGEVLKEWTTVIPTAN